MCQDPASCKRVNGGFHFQARVIVIFVALLAFAGHAGVPSAHGQSGTNGTTEATALMPPRFTLGPKGPWGVLEFEKIPLQNYDSSLPDGTERLRPARWIFENYKVKELKELFESCELTDAQKTFFLNTDKWEGLTNGFVISPPHDLIVGLSQATRQRLYPILGRSPLNYPQSHAFRFPLNGLDERLADSGLSREKLDLIRGQTYTNAGALLLCVDGPLQTLLGANDFNSLARTLYTARTWWVLLRVTPDSDVDALVKYWGKGGRERAIRPLIKSLTRVSEGTRLNVSFLLPPFARLRIYTYPDAINDPSAAREDCFFTALNFFNEQPDYTLTDGDNAVQEISKNYKTTTDGLEFGDLIALVDSDGAAVHICVYVADDFVYTKNGAGLSSPWVLMKVRDMVAEYPSEKPLRIAHFRHKGVNSK